MNIVFVHLNSKLPRYLENNLQTTISTFPEHQVFLIHNGVTKIPKLENLKTYLYVEDVNWNKMESSLSHPRHFRDNFWLISLARFLAIHNFAKETSGEILHLESDVVISRDFPFQKLANQPKVIAFPIASSKRGVATTVYFRDTRSAEKLANFALKIASESPETTDMLILRQFFDRFPEITCPLPTVPKSVDSSSRAPEEPLRALLDENLTYFDGVFDGTDIGPYFFGSNPWNSRGKSVLRMQTPENYAKCMNWLLTHDEARGFLAVSTLADQTKHKVFSAHMLCKNPRIFHQTKRGKIFRERALNSGNGLTTEIYFRVLAKMIIVSLRRRLFRAINKILKK